MIGFFDYYLKTSALSLSLKRIKERTGSYFKTYSKGVQGNLLKSQFLKSKSQISSKF
jgi:hypothetical protein